MSHQLVYNISPNILFAQLEMAITMKDIPYLKAMIKERRQALVTQKEVTEARSRSKLQGSTRTSGN